MSLKLNQLEFCYSSLSAKGAKDGKGGSRGRRTDDCGSLEVAKCLKIPKGIYRASAPSSSRP